jgi:hypothetical protein
VDPNVEAPPPEEICKKDLTTLEPDMTSKPEADPTVKKEVVSQLAMEWDDDDEVQTESA